jgi:FkbM family methyltransferase
MQEFAQYVVKDRRCLDWRFDFLIADPTAAAWYGKADHAEPDKVWCLRHIKPGMTIFDCGAHHGQMTVLFAKATGDTGHVYAWEALPENALIVEKNLALNGCNNATVYPYALGYREGYCAFDRNGGNAQSNGDIKLYAAPLSVFCKACAKIDFMKIDVEGAELDLIKGGLRAIVASSPIIDLELHLFAYSDRIKTLLMIFNLLSQAPYRFSVDEEDNISIFNWLNYIAAHDVKHVYCEPPR